VVVAGTDPESCPNNGSIPCLLLQSVGNRKGPAGGRLLANVTFVQRLNTNGGAAPTTACSVGQTQLVPYTADYYFYHQDQWISTLQPTAKRGVHAHQSFACIPLVSSSSKPRMELLQKHAQGIRAAHHLATTPEDYSLQFANM